MATWYIVDYSKKASVSSDFNAWERQKKKIMTQEQLAHMLTSEPLCVVWRATFVNREEYQQEIESGTYDAAEE